MYIIWELVPLMIAIIAVISFLTEERTIKIILRVICFVGIVASVLYVVQPGIYGTGIFIFSQDK